MEHKNSFHIKKLNHQSGFGWAEMMRAGYVWLAALLCFIWYAAGRFEMYTSGVVLFIGTAFFILLYFELYDEKYFCSVHNLPDNQRLFGRKSIKLFEYSP